MVENTQAAPTLPTSLLRPVGWWLVNKGIADAKTERNVIGKTFVTMYK